MKNFEKDERENEHVSVEQVIELACEIAHKRLVEYWRCLSMPVPMEIEEDSCIRYTELAQDKFNNIYDEVEGTIVSLMQQHPDKTIIQIKECINEEL